MRRVFISICIILAGLLVLGTASGESAPVLNAQPADRAILCGTCFALNVEAEGDGLSFLWQYQDEDSVEWKDWKRSSVGYLYSYSTMEMDRRRVRCVVAGTGGSVTTDVFTIDILPNITEAWYYLTSSSGTLGTYSYATRPDPDETVRFSVTARGIGLKFQWYSRRSYSDPWTPWEGMTASDLSFTARSSDNGLLLNCVVTDSRGRTISLLDKGIRINLEVKQEPASSAEITLWYLNAWAADRLTIPAGLLQEYDLGEKTARITSGNTAEIADGRVRPAGTQTYSVATGTTSVSYSNGDNVLTLEDGTNLTVHVQDYASAYADQVMDDYLAAHITADMTEFEKAVQCCRFSASYDYDASYSGSTSMILTGGGDCWAHSDALLSLLEKLGISAAYHDEREGSFLGHINVMAKLDGKYYELETSVGGRDPEGYGMQSSATPFLLRPLTETTAAISTYLDPEGAAALVIPEKIEGYTITAIDKGAFQARSELLSVTVPGTVTSIGDNAFINCSHLQTVSLPASLSSFGATVFGLCDDLERIDVAAGNPVYASSNGILLGKGGTELIMIPQNYRGACAIPEGVTSIANSACQNMTFDTLILPGTIQQIGEVVFWNTRIDRLILSEGITEIPYGAFARITVRDLVLPASLKTIGNEAFSRGSFNTIEFSEGLETIGDSAFEGCYFQDSRLLLPSTLKYIGARAFLFSSSGATITIGSGTSDPDPVHGTVIFHRDSSPAIGENAFSRFTLGVWSGSSALDYAQKNGTPYFLLDAEGRTPLQKGWFKLEYDTHIYTDSPLTPAVSLTGKEIQPLRENVDYLVSYQDNDAPGSATVTVSGLGTWEGTVDLSFRITAPVGFFTDKYGNTYYYGHDGLPLIGRYIINGKTYLFDENGILVPSLAGDINGDGAVDGRDAVRLMKYLAAEIDPATLLPYEIVTENADLNGDDRIDELDLLRLVRFLGGAEASLQ